MERRSGGNGGRGHVGERIRALRTEQGWSLSQFSDLVHYSKSYLSRVENCTRPVLPELAQRCDEVLGTDGELARLVVAEARPPAPQEPAERAVAVRERPVPAELPATGEMWGRERELARVQEFLARHRGPAVVAVDGMAGVGKTTFAVSLARRLAVAHPDGALYADLCTHSPEAPGDTATRLLQALGAAPEDLAVEPAARAALLRSVLADRRVVVVLDDADRAAQVAPLLPGTGRSLVLVTSRRRLTGLSIRHGALRVTLEPLAAEDAVLVLRRALDRRDGNGFDGNGFDGVGAVGPDGTPLPGGMDDLLPAIARRCAYLPLALRIAAERIVDQDRAFVALLTEEAQPAGARLDVLAVPGDAETAVRSVFDWSYRTLSHEMARALRLLALHPGTVAGVGAAAALWGAQPAAAARLLGELHAAHLAAEVAPGRYQMHDLLREYARERAEAEDGATRADCAERVFAWYLHTAEAAMDRLLGPGRSRIPLAAPPAGCPPLDFASATEALAWCETERTNLLACARAAAVAGSPVAWQLPHALWGFFFLRHYHHDQLESGTVAAEAARGAGPLAEACAALVLASAGAGLRQHAAADAHYRRGVECFREAGDGPGEAGVLLGYAVSSMRQGRTAEAAQHVARALALFEAAQNTWGTALALGTLGEVRLAQGRPEALDLFTQARELHRAEGSLWLEASTWTLSGTAHRERGEHGRAEECYRRAVDLHGRTGMRAGVAHALHQLGVSLRVQGRARQARRAWLRAWAFYAALGDPREADVRACLVGLPPCPVAATAGSAGRG
ncbi:tetratricopeptide repeat protein [Streptomyces sp. NPDC006430]|uniref:tetratricopeptide repeat protein n=1 Tax=Streptomyces sp. NPDC006430 TaxID=3154299 RepID=UPI0033BCAC48